MVSMQNQQHENWKTGKYSSKHAFIEAKVRKAIFLIFLRWIIVSINIRHTVLCCHWNVNKKSRPSGSNRGFVLQIWLSPGISFRVCKAQIRLGRPQSLRQSELHHLLIKQLPALNKFKFVFFHNIQASKETKTAICVLDLYQYWYVK